MSLVKPKLRQFCKAAMRTIHRFHLHVVRWAQKMGPDRKGSRMPAAGPGAQCAVGTLCAQHAKMDRPGNRVFRWEWEDGKP
jgi:hypothetical protein